MPVLIDTHCHIDYFDDPIATAKSYEASGMSCVMVSMLPSQYQMALPHLKPFSSIHPALGVHPLRAKEGLDEIDLFLDLVEPVEFVGEVGLDYSSEGRGSIAAQEKVLDKILPSIGVGKFVSVHSRDAHQSLAEMLNAHSVRPVCFHYFIGGADSALQLASEGHYFSVNLRMLKGRHRTLLDHVPKEKVLVESDGPFLTKKPVSSVREAYAILGDIWGMEEPAVVQSLSDNFLRCRTTINTRKKKGNAMSYEYKLFEMSGRAHHYTIVATLPTNSYDGPITITIKVSDVYLAQYDAPTMDALNTEAVDIIQKAAAVPNLKNGSVVCLRTNGVFLES